ncbi:MAG TPA: protein kinase, partial [Acidimicrobiia bacterium]|nr:protein kinase [Acidimicrobiia bacterium]
DGVLRDAIEKPGGRIFKQTGEGVLAAFPDSVSAAAAAEAALRGLRDADWGEVGRIRVRMGIDVGEAETRNGDLLGPPLTRAAGLCVLGHGGQVLVSEGVQAEMVASAPAGMQIRQLGEYRLRGIGATERVAQLVFDGLQADFPALRMDVGLVMDERADLVSLPGYEVRDRIGEGAFGVVWRAYQPSVGREVAVKVIRPELSSQPSFVRRFEAEARTIARLAHPHIVPLIDFWRDTTSAYLVLALLSGGSLAAAMGRRSLDRSASRRILGQIAAALDHAHAQGIVHGDLKPSNVLLDGSGNAYLSDFGIAVRLLYPEVVSSISSESAYRAPEVMENGASSAGDIYALGVLARELLDGEPGVEAALARATAFAPEDRHPSSSSLLAALDEALGEEPDEVERSMVSRNPYKGLRSFDESDAADFFGRDELVSTLVEAVSEHRFVAVVGPSGSGKSSLVRAGLLPALDSGEQSDRWFRVVVTPGPDPVAALVEALETVSSEVVSPEQLKDTGLGRVVDGALLVVVDQFEEVYTLAGQEQRSVFLELLIDAVRSPDNSVRVVATLRADFYDRPLSDEHIGRLISEGLVTVVPPTRDEMVEMITAPATVVGLKWEPGLPHRIADDVAGRPGGLPLLQYALTELVERRTGELLTVGDYESIGGVAGALANRAEAVFTQFTRAQQQTARQVLLRLVTVDEEKADTRRRVRRSELESTGIPRSDLDTVLDRFTSQRLLLADRDPVTRSPTVEVAHESLLREWPRLAGWIDDQRDSLILRRRFRTALDEWEANNRHPDFLLTGNRLAPFTGWAVEAPLTSEESAYYEASRHRDSEERNARRRRRRTLTGILAVAAIVATILGIVAAVQAGQANREADRAAAAAGQAIASENRAEAEAGRANDEADRAAAAAERAEAEAQIARARELTAAAVEVVDSDPALAKLLAVASVGLAEPTGDTLSVLHQAYASNPVIDSYRWPSDRDVERLGVDLSPDGTQLVASDTWSHSQTTPTRHLEAYDFRRGSVLWSWETGHPSVEVALARYSSDGERVLVGTYWVPEEGEDEGERPATTALGLYIFDADTGDLLRR